MSIVSRSLLLFVVWSASRNVVCCLFAGHHEMLLIFVGVFAVCYVVLSDVRCVLCVVVDDCKMRSLLTAGCIPCLPLTAGCYALFSLVLFACLIAGWCVGCW